MSDWVNRTLSKVEIQQPIGYGGMAEVYLGRHTTLNRPVAVKILHSHLSTDRLLLNRFRSEAQAVAGLRHPNIVQVFDFDIIDGDRPYIVMELLEGPSLKEHLDLLEQQEARLTPQTIVQLIKALASALDYAHSQNIIHRDIKPANVILRSDKGTVLLGTELPDDIELVLTDFGIARIADADQQTASGTIIGTPAYMSPEQVQGENIDRRTDIYALGIMLYEMLSGRVPFAAETQASVLLQQLTVTPPPLEGVSYEVQGIVDQALAKDPARRYQTAGALSEALIDAYNENSGAGLLATGIIQKPGTLDLDTIQLNDLGSQSDTVSPANTLVGESDRRGLTPMWIAAGFGAIAVIIAIIALVIVSGNRPAAVAEPTSAVSPAESSTAESAPTVEEGVVGNPTEETGAIEEPTPEDSNAAIDTTTPRGTVTFRDATVSADFTDLQQPPAGSSYEAWLVGPETDPRSLGTLTVNNGQSDIQFTSPDGEILLSHYNGLVISLEPLDDTDSALSSEIAYQSLIPQEMLDRVRVLYEFTQHRNEPFISILLDGAVSQATQYNNHLGFSVDGINGDNLSGGKLHAEHVINIIAGAASPDYGDWNQDGLPQNPGDDVGLESYLLLIEDALSSVVLITSNEAARQQAEDLHEDAQALVDVIQNAKSQAQQLTATDTIEEARNLASTLETLRVGAALAALTEGAETLSLGISSQVFAVDQ